MRKVIGLVICAALILTGCGSSTSEEATVSATTVNEEEMVASSNAPRNVVLKELIQAQNDGIHAIVEEENKLNDVELKGTSDDSYEQQLHIFQVEDECADIALAGIEGFERNEILTVSGYMGYAIEAAEGNFYAEQGCGRIMFYLKDSVDDSDYDGLICRTDDETFLEIDSNTPVQIQGILWKSGLIGSTASLYDCEILDIGEAPLEEETEDLAESIEEIEVQLEEETVDPRIVSKTIISEEYTRDSIDTSILISVHREIADGTDSISLMVNTETETITAAFISFFMSSVSEEYAYLNPSFSVVYNNGIATYVDGEFFCSDHLSGEVTVEQWLALYDEISGGDSEDDPIIQWFSDSLMDAIEKYNIEK